MSIAGIIARKLAAQALKGRRGHGGGTCTRRVMRLADLEQFALEAIAEYCRVLENSRRFAEVMRS